MTSGIYAIENTVSGRIYIGSSVYIAGRWDAHRSDLNHGRGNPHLQHAWDKYGPDAFQWIVLEKVPVGHLLEREQIYLDYALRMIPRPYNCSPTAGSPLGVRHSHKTRRQQSRVAKELWDKRRHGPLSRWLETLDARGRAKIHDSGMISGFYRDIELEVWEDKEDPEL